jgi:hypothetical protein
VGCLTTLLVGLVVQRDWKVKHPVSEREFSLSVKRIKIRYQTRYYRPLPFKDEMQTALFKDPVRTAQ